MDSNNLGAGFTDELFADEDLFADELFADEDLFADFLLGLLETGFPF